MRNSTEYHMESLFPITFDFDREFRVTSSSQALRTWFPGAEGSRLQDFFTFQLPRDIESFEELFSYENKLVLLVSNNHTVAAKGQLLRHVSGTSLKFVGVPWLSWMSARNPGQPLDLSLFPAFDSQLEQEFLISAQSAMINDAEELESELTALKRQVYLKDVEENQIVLQIIHDVMQSADELESSVMAMDKATSMGVFASAKTHADSAISQLRAYCSSALSFYENVTPTPTTAEEVHIDSLVRNAVRNTAGTDTDGLSPITFQINSDVPDHITSQGDMLEKVLTLLLHGALRRGHEAQLIVSAPSLTEDGLKDLIEFTLTDRSTPLPPDAVNELFSGFNACSDEGRQYATPHLAACQRLTAMIGGSIRVISSNDSGTTIQIRIPRVLDGIKTMKNMNDKVFPENSANSRLAGRALVVGRSVQAECVSRYLLEQNFDIKIAEDAEEGMHFATHTFFPMILVDLSLPISELLDLSHHYQTLPGDTTLIALGSAGDARQAEALSMLTFEAVISGPQDYVRLQSGILPKLHLVSGNHDQPQCFRPTVDLSRLEAIAADQGPYEFDRRKSVFLDSVRHHVRLLIVLVDLSDNSLLVEEATHLSRRLEKYGALAAARALKKYAETVLNGQQDPREAFRQAETAIDGAIRNIAAFQPATPLENQA